MTELPSTLFERHFFQMISSKSGLIDPSVRKLISELITATFNKHSCLDLTLIDDTVKERLLTEPSIGGPEDEKPLVLSRDKLYLSKFYHCESDVAAMISARNIPIDIPCPDHLAMSLTKHFGKTEHNRQKLAAFMAITRKLTIITGGPGTGKTSTVVKILDILIEKTPDLVIKLVAPTGKAAMRLSDSISNWAKAKEKTLHVQTLHRLLGMRKDGRTWRHGPRNPLTADLLIVDEASMIDLMMMQRLLSALTDNTRLIFLGDPDQLPSIDNGNVLADLCAGQKGFSSSFAQLAKPFLGEIEIVKKAHLLTDAVCELNKSYRFDPDSSIGALSKNIQAGQPATQPTDASVSFKSDGQEPLISNLLSYWKDYIDLLAEGRLDPKLLLRTFEQTRILCSRRGGEAGVEAINQDIESALESKGIKSPDNTFYNGRPILITRNDYNIGLFNGDIGISLSTQDGDQFVVNFPDAGKKILASRLPQHESCFAMTVHKAQGSEFSHVILALSEEISENPSNIITRELLYTAITRAKEKISIHCDKNVWNRAVNLSSRRVSGMTEFFRIKTKKNQMLDQMELL